MTAKTLTERIRETAPDFPDDLAAQLEAMLRDDEATVADMAGVFFVHPWGKKRFDEQFAIFFQNQDE